MIRELSSQFSVPFVVLSYYNPILAMGLDRFLKKARESGVDGIVVPDLPLEESDDFRNLALKHNIDNIHIAAPNTSRTRLRTVLDKSKGFLYLVSLYGVTGPRDTLSPQALEAIKTVKSLAKGKIPVSAGFGISLPEHVSAVIQSGADGAIVGSALVRIVGDHLDDPNETETQLKKTVRSLKEATRLKSG
jgi:tryptophan synthase alpha chain